jgi:hypothetical protein
LPGCRAAMPGDGQRSGSAVAKSNHAEKRKYLG